MNRLFQTLAVWIAIGFALQAAGLTVMDLLFWCILVLIWLVEYLARSMGYESGTIDGLVNGGEAIIQLSQENKQLKEKLKQYEQHSSTS